MSGWLARLLGVALDFCVLSSGSAGNCLWVRGGGVELLVDAGLPLRTIGARMEAVGQDVRAVSAVLCTHGHGDHVGGAAVVARRIGAQLIGTPSTLAAIPFGPPADRLQPIGARSSVRLGGLRVTAAPTPHDAPGSVCFVVDDGETSLGVVTDLGTHTRTLVDHLSGLDALVLETNHDVQRLEDGPYPARLKRRIRSDAGHLSNEQGARLLSRVLHPGLQHLVLAHLSEQNNEPALARAAIEPVIAGHALRLHVAQQHAPGDPVRLRARRGAQLGFAFG
jgi:phosphoribosyl 1,2-cyclic phosphodiesterase